MSVHRIETGWRVRWREGSRNRSRSFTRKRDAELFDAEQRRLRQFRGVDHVVGDDTTLEAWAQEWWRDYAEAHLLPRTRANYATQLDTRIVPELGSMRLREIRPATVESWIAKMQRRGDGAPSIVRASAVLSAILQRALVADLVDMNAARAARKPRLAPPRRVDPIPPKDIEAIRSLLKLYDATLVSVLAYAGLRPESEALPLTWGDVGEKTLRIHATKTGATRHVRLLKPLADDLKAWCKSTGGNAQGTSLVFPRDGGSWSNTDWQNWRRRVWRPAATEAGLPAGSRPRDLRSSYASLLIASGMSVVEVAQELGHSPSMCLTTYARAFAEYDPKRRISAEQAIKDARGFAHTLSRQSPRKH
jgi:site-specific recombinase XerC